MTTKHTLVICPSHSHEELFLSLVLVNNLTAFARVSLLLISKTIPSRPREIEIRLERHLLLLSGKSERQYDARK
jgi:hypothetical protein